MEIKQGNEAKAVHYRIGKVHITAGDNGAAIDGNTEEVIKSFIHVCETMAIINVPEEMLIDIVKATQEKMKDKPKVCPRCENVEIGKQDNFCKICGYKF